jgi:peptide-methionine (R)-S-oxide reductase
MSKIEKSDEEWRKSLTPEQYRVLRQKGTERAFHGRVLGQPRRGPLRVRRVRDAAVRSEAKFDSGTGWPSFTAPVSPDAVATETDESHGMVRTEALCAACGGHLGHVFPDGPRPTGLRYCINSVSLKKEPA